MILTLDVGNSQIFGGVFDGDDLTIRFRKSSRWPASSDELGLFLRHVLRENGGDPTAVHQIACCSVVPDAVYSLRSCCRKYFGLDPFILQAGVRTGLRLLYRNPLDVGADRIANAIGASHLYPDTNLIIVDFGTATTIDVVRVGREHLGGIIMPGIRIQMEALEKHTSRLPSVEIVAGGELIGRSTVECIQSGLYFGTRAAVEGLTTEIRQRVFGPSAGGRGTSGADDQEGVLLVATGGFCRLFEGEQMFDVVLPDLVHVGLRRALTLNMVTRTERARHEGAR